MDQRQSIIQWNIHRQSITMDQRQTITMEHRQSLTMEQRQSINYGP